MRHDLRIYGISGRAMFFAAIMLVASMVSVVQSAAVSRPSYNKSTGFFVKDGKLYDANGVEFIARGVNNTHGWDDWKGAMKASDGLDEIAAYGFNSVRIVWAAGISKWGFPGKDGLLEGIIQKCVDLKMIPMPELHDWTGGNDTKSISDKAADYWVKHAALIKKFEKYILVNIANEWGNGNTTDEAWRDAYKGAITKIRNAGINATLIVDATLWAKRMIPIKKYGQEVLNHDPQKNVVFALHYYCGDGENSTAIKSNATWARENKMPFLIGEFNTHHLDECKVVKAKDIIAACQQNGQGYYWWAFVNGPFSAAKDFAATGRDGLTTDGKWLIYDDANGIQKTSKPASVFGTVGTLEPSNYKVSVAKKNMQSAEVMFAVDGTRIYRITAKSLSSGVYLSRKAGSGKRELLIIRNRYSAD